MQQQQGWIVALAVVLGACSLINSTKEFADDGGGQADAGPGLEAGAPDAGCDLQCDGVCTNSQTDPLHCGSCGTSCSAPENGVATCDEGSCGFICEAGYYAVLGRCEPRLAPRPIAPLSTATATSHRPTFRWELGARSDGARIEICADRACNTVLQTIDAAGTSGRPSTDLPSGVVFWRLYGREGDEVGVMPSVTWQLYIGARSAPVDTSWGTTLDVNGDGFADVIIGAPNADSDAGRAYLYLGDAEGISLTPTAVLDNGTDGGNFGCSIASAGDVDGDGYADVVIGAYRADSATGRAYLYRGGDAGLSVTPTPIENDADGGFFGSTVASAGDVDGDGYADVLVGAPGVNTSYGRAYLYRGRPSGLAPTPVALDNGAVGGAFGTSLASAGDVDGDGYSDIIIGAPYADSYAGRAYFYRGAADGISLTPMVLDNGADGGQFGVSVANAGDVDGDGYADVIIGAMGADRAYVFRGDADGFMASPTPLDNGTDGGFFGGSVASAGDVDGDGRSGVIVGAAHADARAGRAYLYRGDGVSVSLTPTVLDNGADGGRFGTSLASVGDLNGDGYADVIIGAIDADEEAGRAYLYRGSASGSALTPTVLDNGADGGGFGSAVAWIGMMLRSSLAG